ncbi:MAG TPA: VOC family protein [Acidimicrobiales bacterium]
MKIVRITLAVDDIDEMVAFYNEAFQCGLVAVAGSPVYVGLCAGVVFQLCPNSLAGVVAEQNRHQIRLAVGDPEQIAVAVVTAGGAVVNRSGNGDRLVIGVSDPEGNTMELVPE